MMYLMYNYINIYFFRYLRLFYNEKILIIDRSLCVYKLMRMCVFFLSMVVCLCKREYLHAYYVRLIENFDFVTQ